jgi:hypothetical protein
VVVEIGTIFDLLKWETVVVGKSISHHHRSHWQGKPGGGGGGDGARRYTDNGGGLGDGQYIYGRLRGR